MDVSVIIVNYNTKDLILNCINSICEKTSGIDYEIIVIDNASKDGSQQLIKNTFPFVSLVENNANLGFGKANNIGAKIATGKYLFFLNSDCILIENTIFAFFSYMESYNTAGSIGVIGALLLDSSMKLNSSYNKLPTIINQLKTQIIAHFNKIFFNKVNLPEICNYNISGNINEVEFITGADLFLSKNIFDKLSGFDEQFFLYFEETDLQKRMQRMGLKRIILRNEKILHLGGQSSLSHTKTLKSSILYVDSMFLYYKKYYSYIKYIIFYLLIIPFLIYPLLLMKYSGKDKKNYFKTLLRIPVQRNSL